MFSRIMHPLSSHKIHLDGLWEKTPLQLEMYDDSSAALCLRAHWVLIASCQFVMSHIRQGEACTFETNLTRLRSANITETHLSISLNMFIPKCYKFRISESFLQPTNQPTNQQISLLKFPSTSININTQHFRVLHQYISTSMSYKYHRSQPQSIFKSCHFPCVDISADTLRSAWRAAGEMMIVAVSMHG